jgi:hypothetical protein
MLLALSPCCCCLSLSFLVILGLDACFRVTGVRLGRGSARRWPLVGRYLATGIWQMRSTCCALTYKQSKCSFPAKGGDGFVFSPPLLVFLSKTSDRQSSPSCDCGCDCRVRCTNKNRASRETHCSQRPDFDFDE